MPYDVPVPFAKTMFNRLASDSDLPLRAGSRALHLYPATVGPISVYTVQGPEWFGIKLDGNVRFPIGATNADFYAADLVIAVKEAEHRRMIERSFSAWLDRVEFWHIHDVDCAEPEEALAELHAAVVALHGRLRGTSTTWAAETGTTSA